MGKRVLGDISTTSILSRHEKLAAEVEGMIDNDVHADGEILRRGALLGKIQAGAGNGTAGNFRAYAEAEVAEGGAFANDSDEFTLDPDSPLLKHFREGDVIQSTGGTALGTIESLDYETGEGTLAANSANNLAAGQMVRISTAEVALGFGSGRVLKEEVLMGEHDEPAPMYVEGYFNQERTTITDAAITAMGAVEVTDGEVRIR